MNGEQSQDRILHGFADCGVEAEALSVYGDVYRFTLNPRQNPYSQVAQMDLSDPDALPFDDDQFDLAVLHPPCTAYSDMPDANKDGDAPKLVPEARKIGERYAEHYVIENKPAAPLKDPVVLDGKMFGLPLKYERAFETSFPVDQPPRQSTLGTETSPFFYSERSPAWWRAAKGGIRGDYPKEHVAKNSLPLPYVHHLCRAWMAETGVAEGVADYSDYDAQMDERRAREVNHSLEGYANAE
jgi:hypothetical protein